MATGGVPTVVTPLGWYETPMARMLIARFDFVRPFAGMTHQFGWVAFEPNPDWKPTVEPTGIKA